MLVSKYTRTPEDNGDLHVIRTEKEGNLIPQGTTLHDDSVVSSKSPLPPLVLYIPQTIPQQSDLGRINDLEESFEKGYNSDGLQGPFFNAVDAEGEQDFDEGLLDDTPHTPDIEEDDTVFNDTLVGTNEVVLTNDSIMGMNVKVLKEELKKRRLRISGNKRSLQE